MPDDRPAQIRVRLDTAAAALAQAWPAIVTLPLLLLAWEASSRWLGLDPLMLPPPSAIAEQLRLGLASGLYVTHFGVTVSQALLGFLGALVAGVVVGSLIGSSVLLERTVHPFLVAFQSMPKIALAPLIIVWFGYGIGSKVVLAGVLGFFPILIGTVTGLKSAEQGRIDVMRVLGASPWQLYRMVRLPSALPYIFAGINVAAVLVVLGAIVGEFVGSKSGLGTLIIYANQNLEIAQVFSILAILAALGLSMHFGVLALRTRLLFWAEDRRPGEQG